MSDQYTDVTTQGWGQRIMAASSLCCLAWRFCRSAFLGSLAETGAFLLAVTVSVPLTLIVIAVAWIAHRPWLGGGLLAGALLAFVALHSAFARRPPRSRVL